MIVFMCCCMLCPGVYYVSKKYGANFARIINSSFRSMHNVRSSYNILVKHNESLITGTCVLYYETVILV